MEQSLRSPDQLSFKIRSDYNSQMVNLLSMAARYWSDQIWSGLKLLVITIWRGLMEIWSP